MWRQRAEKIRQAFRVFEDFVEGLMVAVLAAALVIIGVVCLGMGAVAPFVQGPPPLGGRKGGFFHD
jgi:hypothetical protein